MAGESDVTSLLPPEHDGSGTNKHLLKTSLRQELIKKRRSLTFNAKKTSEDILYRKIITTDLWKAKNIGFYWAKHDELSLERLIKLALLEGKNCFLPKILNSTDMEFVQFKSILDLKEHKYGFLEPKSGPAQGKCLLDIIFVPCIGLNKNGHRIGYGKGYYDRYFQNNKATSIAIAFKCQEFKEEIFENWDQACDFKYLV